MRATTRTVMSAFLAGHRKTARNTHTDGQAVWLHGNKIIERDDNGFAFTLAGWNTVTTRERINGFLALIDSPCRVFQKDFCPMFSTPAGVEEISTRDWIHHPLTPRSCSLRKSFAPIPRRNAA